MKLRLPAVETFLTSWCRCLGPIVGAILGAFAYRKFIGRHLPCDTCVVEEKDSTATTQQNASL
ncbi:glycerol uptake facilitator protein [Salmonella enterica subsp. enterica]|uniref:Glycerol uptake facilitator protein n=1 Tax=Salmonella enterica I TaxID=59201 RepID=A0A3S4IMI5_SALET|nr:glycerol uptake facilitator protein [Salmonella enterica subsp. enterica]